MTPFDFVRPHSLSQAVALLDPDDPHVLPVGGATALIQMMKVGEETGDLGNILKTLANFYSREVVTAVDNLVDLIEPAMIVMLGLGVGVLVASVLVPIYNISSAQ